MSIAATGLFQVCPTLAAASRRAPKTLRYRVLNTAARLVRGGRRRYLKIQATWPWAESITAAWQRIDALLQAPVTSPNPTERSRKENPGARGTPATRPASRAAVIPRR